MTPLLPALALAVSFASAGALDDLRQMAGAAAAELRSAPTVAGAAVARAMGRAAAALDPVIRVNNSQWNPAFPLEKSTVDSVGRQVGTKAFYRYSCEYTPGAATARCDFAYDVWPEICWYGYDHVVADLAVADGAATVVKREWRAD
jgi:hypothetical protein